MDHLYEIGLDHNSNLAKIVFAKIFEDFKLAKNNPLEIFENC